METKFKPRAPDATNAARLTLPRFAIIAGGQDAASMFFQPRAGLCGCWGREGMGQGLAKVPAMHCKDCGHAASGLVLTLAQMAGVIAAAAGLITAILSPTIG